MRKMARKGRNRRTHILCTKSPNRLRYAESFDVCFGASCAPPFPSDLEVSNLSLDRDFKPFVEGAATAVE